jgi:hypothetical protein
MSTDSFYFLGFLEEVKHKRKISLSSMKALTNSEDCSESRIIISVPASFSCNWPIFSSVYPLLGAGKNLLKCIWLLRLSEQLL